MLLVCCSFYLQHLDSLLSSLRAGINLMQVSKVRNWDKKSVDRKRERHKLLLGRGERHKQWQEQLSLSPPYSPPHLQDWEPTVVPELPWELQAPTSTCGHHFPKPGSELPAASVSPQASHLQSHAATSPRLAPLPRGQCSPLNSPHRHRHPLAQGCHI